MLFTLAEPCGKSAAGAVCTCGLNQKQACAIANSCNLSDLQLLPQDIARARALEADGQVTAAKALMQSKGMQWPPYDVRAC